MTKSEYITLKFNGSIEAELVEYVFEYLGDEVKPLRPLAIKLEGSSEKDLLTTGLEE